MLRQLHHIKFWPPFLFLSITIGFSLIYEDSFLKWLQSVNNSLLSHFGWVFSWGALFFLLILFIIYWSPVSKMRIGGPTAQPMLSRWKWFSITICTTIATGILFWGTAEPLYHLNQPPEALGFQAGGLQARNFAMSSMFMHWTFTPYGIYTLAGLVFAISYYNKNQPFQIGSLLFPVVGSKSQHQIGTIADIICLYSLIAGMSASLGAGILTIAGGLHHVLDIDNNTILLGIIGFLILITFIISAASGLMKGIRILSDFNLKIFFVLAAIFLFAGPMTSLLEIGFGGLIEYLVNFFPRSINWGDELGAQWFQSWTIFNWANWLAWTPITALFLGKLSVGYTVREYIHINLVFPALFGALWMIIFSGTALYTDLENNGQLFQMLQSTGPEVVIYQLIDNIPFSTIITGFFLLVTFISYVTAADSNTSAMSNICTKGITPDHPESPLYIKVAWGLIIGLIAWIMITFAGIDGIKMISVLGGFPALIIMLFVAIGALRIVLNSFKTDKLPE